MDLQSVPTPLKDVNIGGDVKVDDGDFVVGNKIVQQIDLDSLLEKIAQEKFLSKQKRVFPALLPYRVNRGRQEDELHQLYKMNDPQSPLPMVAVIHGGHQQVPTKFLERIKIEFIPMLLKSNPPIEDVRLSWPTYINSTTDLETKLTQKLANYFSCPPDAKPEDVQHVIASYNCPVIIQMEVLADDLLRHKQGILSFILNYWHKWPELVPHQQLFVVLYVTHTTHGLWWIHQLKHRQILRQIEGCPLHPYSRIHALYFSELTNIYETDARSWASMAAKELGREEEFLLRKIDELFKDGKPKPMEFLAEGLKKILTSASDD